MVGCLPVTGLFIAQLSMKFLRQTDVTAQLDVVLTGHYITVYRMAIRISNAPRFFMHFKGKP